MSASGNFPRKHVKRLHFLNRTKQELRKLGPEGKGRIVSPILRHTAAYFNDEYWGFLQRAIRLIERMPTKSFSEGEDFDIFKRHDIMLGSLASLYGSVTENPDFQKDFLSVEKALGTEDFLKFIASSHEMISLYPHGYMAGFQKALLELSKMNSADIENFDSRLLRELYVTPAVHEVVSS